MPLLVISLMVVTAYTASHQACQVRPLFPCRSQLIARTEVDINYILHKDAVAVIVSTSACLSIHAHLCPDGRSASLSFPSSTRLTL